MILYYRDRCLSARFNDCAIIIIKKLLNFECAKKYVYSNDVKDNKINDNVDEKIFNIKC